MKHLLTGLLALFVFAPAVRAEVIDAVLFNPSRLGRYENLKVSSELDASGGVNVQTATVQSHSAVNVNSPSGYNLENVSAHKVNLPNTAFQSSSFQAAGGKASFGSGEIQNLKDSAQKMRVKGKTVTVGKDVTVEMLGGEDSSNQEVKGLRLGGNDIPQPVSGCVELGWYAQKAASGKEYKVLGFKSCPGGEEEEGCSDAAKDRCLGGGHDGTAGTWNEKTCECTCPEGYYLDEREGVCEKEACTKTCGTGYTLNESTCECEKKNPCDDATYKAAHECECDPDPKPGPKYCTQDEAYADGMVFDKKTCTCGCPPGQVMAKPENDYWFCHKPGEDGTYWVLMKKEHFGGGCGWGYSTCNIPSSNYPWQDPPKTYKCDVDELGNTCEVQDDNNDAIDGNMGIDCAGGYISYWVCSRQ